MGGALMEDKTLSFCLRVDGGGGKSDDGDFNDDKIRFRASAVSGGADRGVVVNAAGDDAVPPPELPPPPPDDDDPPPPADACSERRRRRRMMASNSEFIMVGLPSFLFF